MTDLVPSQPNGAAAPMVSRQAVTPAAPVPAHVGAFKPENLQMAEAIARASDVLPYSYKTKRGEGQPGAVLLALDYAQRHDLALVDVFAEVAFQGGKPIVGARMQKKLASRYGVTTRLIESSAEAATVAVFDKSGTELGRATYTMETAEALGICFEKDGRTLKGPWRDRENMLFHRATTRALDRYGPSELAGTFVEVDDGLISPDPVDVVTTPQEPPAVAEPFEVAEPAPAAEEPPPADQDAEAEVRALAKKHKVKIPDVLKYAQAEWPDAETALTTIEAIAADQAMTTAIKGWIQAQ